MKHKILKLNKNFMPCGIAPWKEVVKNIFTDAVYPLDMVFECGVENEPDFGRIEYFDVVRTLEEWLKLPVRSFDDFVRGANSVMRLPSVVVCADYDKSIRQRAIFPTKKNVWERDKYTCGYTLKKLNKDSLSIDHIVPKSRCEALGVEANSWENLITCDKKVNNKKDNMTPAEAGLKLKLRPFRPKSGWVFSEIRDQWRPFLGE